MKFFYVRRFTQKSKYMYANPKSDFGNPNVANKAGWDFVCMKGHFLVYRRKPWYRGGGFGKLDGMTF